MKKIALVLAIAMSTLTPAAYAAPTEMTAETAMTQYGSAAAVAAAVAAGMVIIVQQKSGT